MRIGIDISQLAYDGTGVAIYLQNLVKKLIVQDNKNEYILFYSSFRRNFHIPMFNAQRHKNLIVKKFKLPPFFLDILWNKLHLVPIEWFIGPVDVFISSDWTQPPTKAKKVTIIYDMIVYKYPNETAKKIVQVQKRRLEWVRKEIDRVICISKATKEDVIKLFNIQKEKLSVIYPGI